MAEEKLEKIKILLASGRVVGFTGKHRPDLNKPNWHYYEDEHGNIQHFRKVRMEAVLTGDFPLIEEE